MPPTRRVAIETRGADGEWSAYTGQDIVADSNQSLQGTTEDRAILGSEELSALVPWPMSEYKSPPLTDGFAVSPYLLPHATNSHVVLGLETSSSLGHVNENRAMILSNQEPPLFGSPLSLWNDSFFLADFGSSIEIDYPWSFDPSVSQLSRPPLVAFPALPPTRLHSRPSTGLENPRSSNSKQLSQPSSNEALILSINLLDISELTIDGIYHEALDLNISRDSRAITSQRCCSSFDRQFNVL